MKVPITKALFLPIALFCFSDSQLYADTIEEIVVVSPRVSTSGTGWELTNRMNDLYRGIQDQDIDDLNSREEHCEDIENIARLDCEVKVLSNVTGRIQSCSSHLVLPNTTSEFDVNTGILNGTITIEAAGGRELYDACLNTVNAYKEGQLKHCQSIGIYARQRSGC